MQTQIINLKIIKFERGFIIMHDINAILEEMRKALPSGPVRIKEAKESGTKVVGTYCVFSPYAA